MFQNSSDSVFVLSMVALVNKSKVHGTCLLNEKTRNVYWHTFLHKHTIHIHAHTLMCKNNSGVLFIILPDTDLISETIYCPTTPSSSGFFLVWLPQTGELGIPNEDLSIYISIYLSMKTWWNYFHDFVSRRKTLSRCSPFISFISVNRIRRIESVSLLCSLHTVLHNMSTPCLSQMLIFCQRKVSSCVMLSVIYFHLLHLTPYTIP